MLNILASLFVGIVIFSLCVTQNHASEIEERYWLDYNRIMRGDNK